MARRVTLESLIERDFADGYAEFRDLVERQMDIAEVMGMPARDRATLRINHLLTVAMVEAMNDIEERFEIPPKEGIVQLWRGVGVCLALMNAQAFTTCFGPVRKEMLSVLTDAYGRTSRAMAAENMAGKDMADRTGGGA